MFIKTESININVGQNVKHLIVLKSSDGYELPSDENDVDLLKKSVKEAFCQLGCNPDNVIVLALEGISSLELTEVNVISE